MHKPPERGGKCESGVARGMLGECKTEEGEDITPEMDIERQEGKREEEKFVHGIRNGKLLEDQRMKEI
eukprot:6197506-Pleurochrysis_carterae.AAC.1